MVPGDVSSLSQGPRLGKANVNMIRYPPTTISVTLTEVKDYERRQKSRVAQTKVESPGDQRSPPKTASFSSSSPQLTPAASLATQTDDETDKAAYSSLVVSVGSPRAELPSQLSPLS